MALPRKILVVGDAAVDVVATHAGAVPHGGDARGGITLTTGGAGANTAAWLAYCGVEVVLVTRVGDDMAGRQAREELTTAGVRCAFTIDEEAATCAVVVLVDADGQRSLLADRGAGSRLRATDLDPALLAAADHLHMSGYVLLDEGSREAGSAMLADARAAGLSTSVDPQAATHITDPAEFLAMVDGVDLLLPNLDELAALTGTRDPATAAKLLDHVGAVAVTTGPTGATWVDADGITSVPAAAGDCVDSTGAGDAFDAGVLDALLAGAPVTARLEAGVRLGALAVGRVGAQPAGR
jgi:sugar/nucleoside kinase (ribokinase family)